MAGKIPRVTEILEAIALVAVILALENYFVEDDIFSTVLFLIFAVVSISILILRRVAVKRR
ncbi:hypothetical protein [Frankia gtarii]|uniref:hypothetical protein n=1 Tax=Frankia gtarii TaxID=2950102 RepID=UPI0034D4532A